MKEVDGFSSYFYLMLSNNLYLLDISPRMKSGAVDFKHFFFFLLKAL